MANKKAQLTKAQVEYLVAHSDMGNAELAKDMGISVTAVTAARTSIPKVVREPAFVQAMARHDKRSGVAIMTEAASMIGDEISNRGAITQDQINAALAAGNKVLADQLISMRAQKQRDEDIEAKATNAGRFHYIK